LLGKDIGTDDETTAVAVERLYTNRVAVGNGVFYVVHAEKLF
jgi:hypothetical protein